MSRCVMHVKRIRPSKYIFYNFWKLLGSNSEILLIG